MVSLGFAFYGGTLGFHPKPRKGALPPSPRYWGEAPRGQVFGGLSLLWPCVPLWGYAPKPHARDLATHRKWMCGVCAAALQLVEKNCEVPRILPLCGASFPTEGGSAPRNSRGAWGEAPNGKSEPKQNGAPKLIVPLGRSPNNGVQGDNPPCRGLGQRPNVPRSHSLLCRAAHDANQRGHGHQQRIAVA